MSHSLVSSGTIYQKMTTRQEQIETQLVGNTSRYFQERGFQWTSVGWSDSQRSMHSNLGPNITDTTFSVRGSKGSTNHRLKFLRRPNYLDKTMTLAAKDIAIPVETPDGVPEGRHLPGISGKLREVFPWCTRTREPVK